MLRVFKRAFLFSAFFFVCSCGPVRLYDGPELPDSQTAVVRGHGISVQGKSWSGNRDARVPEGMQKVECRSVFYGKAKSCSTSKSFDYSAQSSCEATQAEESRKYGSPITRCESCSFERLRQECIVPAYHVNCETTIDMKGGQSYDITCDRDVDPYSAYHDTLTTASLRINGRVVSQKNVCHVASPRDESVFDDCDSCAVVSKCPER